MSKTNWTYVFYRGDEVQFVGDAEESMSHFNISKEILKWLATPIARRRAEESQGGRLYAEKVDPDSAEE